MLNRAWLFRTACRVVAVILCCGMPQCLRAQENGDKQSCQAFVQKFYDWYWNQVAERAEDPGFSLKSLRPMDELLKRQPPVLSKQLTRLLKRDDRGAKASGEMGEVGFDPFLNSNTPRGKYVVDHVVVAGDMCHASLPAGHLVAELSKAGPTWVFVNFVYSYYYANGTKQDIPDNDLVHILTW